MVSLIMNNLINPSSIPNKHTRQLRELTRLRVKIVQTRTAYKNRCHKILERANIKLSTVLSDLFVRAGTRILQGLGKSIDRFMGKQR